MTIQPLSINNNLCPEFPSNTIEELSVMAGGYIITPLGEIILVGDKEYHCDVFSKYINSYLEKEEDIKYNTLTATKILCELGCCVYAGVRLEYIKNKKEKLENSMASLTIPNNYELLTDVQKEICLQLLKTNKSLFGEKERIYIQYGSFPDNVYTKEEMMKILKIIDEKRNIIT